MSEDWAAVAAEVAEALGEFQAIALTQPGVPGGYDPMTDTTTPGTDPVEHIGSGVEDNFSAFAIASGVVQADDIRFLLSPLKADGFPMPRPVADAWTATLGGRDYAIKRVEAIQPAGMPVLFELQLRA